jgi:uncharacterized OsmC-like protein
MGQHPVDRQAVQQLLVNRAEAPDETFVFGAQRVTLELEGPGNGPFRAQQGSFSWIVDEPVERGGQNTGPNPLAYFLSGTAACLLSHYMLNAISEAMTVASLRLIARGHYNRVLEGGRFRDIVYDVHIETGASPDAVRRLAERAEAQCYAHNTLVAAGVSMTTNVHVNSALVFTLEK